MSAREFLEALTASVSRDHPVLARGLLANQLRADDPLWQWATLATEHVLRITGDDEQRIAACAEAFVVTSLDFLRLQARFMKTGHYAHSSADESVSLYSDGERMSEYLDGLALTYAMWPNHTRMLRFFGEEFVPIVPPGCRVLEIGPGHGLLASAMLGSRPDLQYVGVDISPHSVAYSARAFAAAGIAESRYELVVADAGAPDAAGSSRGQFGAAVCCEVLEHVNVPGAVLESLAAQVESRQPVFVSTVANMEAEDHVYLFHDADDIRGLFGAHGFAIDAEQPLELAGAESMVPKPLNYSAIVRSFKAPTRP